jgi:hypothetical protein
LENRLLWKTIVIQKGLFELSAFWKVGGLWRAFLRFWRHLSVKRLLHLDFFLVQQPLSRHTSLKGENFVANILIKAVKIVTDTIEISEGLTYEADLNGL